MYSKQHLALINQLGMMCRVWLDGSSSSALQQVSLLDAKKTPHRMWNPNM